MERRTMTIKWDELDDFDVDDDDNNDEFFESTNRLSAVVPLDMPLSEFDDNDAHTRVSFSNNRSSKRIDSQYDMWMVAPGSITGRRRRLLEGMGLNDNDDDGDGDTRVSFSNNLAPNAVTPASDFQYDMWMVAPGSITDRRRRLLQGMGLNSNKDFARLPSATSIKLNNTYSKKQVSIKPAVSSPKTSIENEKPNPCVVVDESLTELKESAQKPPESHPPAQVQVQTQVITESRPQPDPEPEHDVQAQAQAQAPSLPVLLIRARSDGDIDTSSFYTRKRKEGMIGAVSKQRLTRTSSELVTPSVGLSCQYANIIRVSTPNTELPKKSLAATTQQAATSTPVDSFFLIKNLDTGKEFVVKESNDEGMWNKVSDLQTGEQLTMDEFEETVGHSPVVKELMRRASRKRNGNAGGKLAATNSYLSKSFRNSKRKGAAFLKNLTGSMSGSKAEKEKEKDDSTTTTTTEQKTSEVPKTTEKPKTSKKQKTTEKQKTSEKQKTTEKRKTNKKQKTIEKQKTSEKQKASGEEKASNDKNSSSEWVKVRAHGKPTKEFSALHFCQEIQAHDGSIWTMRFTFDGQILATAGEDKVINIWEVQECDVMSMRSGDDKGSITPDNRPPLPENSATSDKKKKAKNSKKKPGVPDYAKVPETMFGLSEKPICTLSGHQADVLDLSWCKSQLLLSSSMDKTVRLWDIETKNCLKQFVHSDYVTCIHFNPADEDYFISGSLDTKVRIWSVPGRNVVDWSDVHDMITSVCYYPDGQGAIVGLHNGNCKSYSTTDCKLEQKDQVELHTKPKADPKKITGFQFSPTNPSEMLVTSADSRIRVLDGVQVINKLIGYKNTSSQFSAQYSADGKYVICASEDSQVYIWKHENPKNTSGVKTKYVTTASYEHFSCTDVTVALPWPGSRKLQHPDDEPQSKQVPPTSDDNVKAKKTSQLPLIPKTSNEKGDDSEPPSLTDTSGGELGNGSSRLDSNSTNNIQLTVWGLVIVTAGVGGEIRVYQNVGLPVKVGTNLF